jgi:replicative DNA helicase
MAREKKNSSPSGPIHISETVPMADFSQIRSTFAPSPGLRMPPQNVEAEMSVLGSIMLDKQAYIKVSDILLPESFYKDVHRIIFEAMTVLAEKHEPIDVLSVSNRLRETSLLDAIGGTTYLTSLITSVPTASNVVHYAEIVQRKFLLRNLIEVSQEIGQLGYQESEDIQILLDEAEKKVFGITKSTLKQKFESIATGLSEAWERIDRLHNGEGQLRGVPSGFTDIDNLLSGFQKSDFVILAARPSLGKTTLALDIVRHVAIKENIPVGFFSLEMSTDQLVDRLISSEAQVDLWKMRTGKINDEQDFLRIQNTLNTLSKAPIFIDDEASNTILQMRAMARRLKAEHGLGLIVVDYLQLINSHRSSDNMVQQITEISRSLKALARELDVPVLALSQLSRAVEQRTIPIPKLSDLRESGSIEQDADIVMFIYREDRYKDDVEQKNIAEIIIAKHRNGPLGKVQLYFNAEKVCFQNLDTRH